MCVNVYAAQEEGSGVTWIYDRTKHRSGICRITLFSNVSSGV
jgi:hypothetical protein